MANSFISMEPFLRKRGVQEDTLKALRDQKIDEDAARGMTDADLKEYLQKKGDRFALRDFLTEGLEKPKTRKASLMDRLRDRLRSSRASYTDTSNEETESVAKKIPKLSAKKEEHKVHLGWYHFDEGKKMYVHVRAKAGGGKRTVMLNKSMNKQSIIKECLNLFFPDGESQHGELKDMDFELTDFQLKPLEDEQTTLGDIIDKAKLQFVHFYLRTRQKKQLSDDEGLDGTQEQTDQIKISASPSKAGQQLKESKNTPGESSKVVKEDESYPSSSTENTSTNPIQHFTDLTEKVLDFIESSEDNVLKEDSSKRPLNPDVGDDGDSSSLPDPAILLLWEDNLGEATLTPTIPIIPIVREPKEFSIVVHRGQVLRELIKIFKENSDVDFKKDIILASIILPNGEREQAYDSGGVMRDMLSEFWEDFYEQCTTGTDLKIPCLRHDMEADDWRAVGKIIALGWILQKVLPIRLAPNFLKSSLFGLGSDKLREEFLQFIPKSESGIISNAIGDMEKADMDELLEILSTHDCKVKITKDNIGPVIDQIAHLEMVQEPAFIRECLFEVLITYELVLDVDSEFQKITPTSKKLLSTLKCDEPESESFKYLKRYIREIEDTKMLRTLLRFITASDLMLYNSEGKFFTIQVKIVDMEGILRRPIAHTCGRVLDIPKAYESYTVFRTEMNAVLNSSVWVMDFA